MKLEKYGSIYLNENFRVVARIVNQAIEVYSQCNTHMVIEGDDRLRANLDWMCGNTRPLHGSQDCVVVLKAHLDALERLAEAVREQRKYGGDLGLNKKVFDAISMIDALDAARKGGGA